MGSSRSSTDLLPAGQGYAVCLVHGFRGIELCANVFLHPSFHETIGGNEGPGAVQWRSPEFKAWAA